MLKMLVGIIVVIVSGVFCMAMAKAARRADDRMDEIWMDTDESDSKD